MASSGMNGHSAPSSQPVPSGRGCFFWPTHLCDRSPKKKDHHKLGSMQTSHEERGDSNPDAPVKAIVSERLVAIPSETLTAEDCDPLQKDPPPLAALTNRLIEFVVPATSMPGCTLVVPLNAGEQVRMTMPEHVKAGDSVHLCQRVDGSWRISKKAKKFSFVLPDCGPGDSVRLNKGPDGFPVCFEVPLNSEPGDIITLQRTNGTEWAFDGTQRMRTPIIEPSVYDSGTEQGSYKEVLNFIHNRVRSMRKLTMTENGIIRVNVPFCGHFYEYAVLGNFVANSLLTLPGVKGGRIVATELNDDYVIDWAMAHRWFRAFQPSIQLEVYSMDLAQDPLPTADITIAIHPEVTKGGAWFPIISSIIRSGGGGGLCLFACFYMAEAETVVNMVHMYGDNDTYVEVIENPYYMNNEIPDYPPRRYFVAVSSEHPAGYEG